MVDQPEESDLRRRAAWLLAMLAVVAVLFVVLLTFVLDSGSSSKHNNGTGPDDTLAPSQSTSKGAHSTRTSAARQSTSSSSTSSGPATQDCPTQDPCALQGDFGKAIDAVNRYRVQNGQQQVPGTVSTAAQKCAVSNGSDCSGGWAESQVPGLDGAKAVDKVSKLGKLLDPQMKSFEIGWAYSPRAKQYFFAIVRKP